jgi:hypothetical protein
MPATQHHRRNRDVGHQQSHVSSEEDDEAPIIEEDQHDHPVEDSEHHHGNHVREMEQQPASRLSTEAVALKAAARQETEQYLHQFGPVSQLYDKLSSFPQNDDHEKHMHSVRHNNTAQSNKQTDHSTYSAHGVATHTRHNHNSVEYSANAEVSAFTEHNNSVGGNDDNQDSVNISYVDQLRQVPLLPFIQFISLTFVILFRCLQTNYIDSIGLGAPNSQSHARQHHRPQAATTHKSMAQAQRTQPGTQVVTHAKSMSTSSSLLPQTSAAASMSAGLASSSYAINDITSDLLRIRKQLNDFSGIGPLPPAPPSGLANSSSSYRENQVPNYFAPQMSAASIETDLLRRHGAIKDVNLSADTQELLDRVRARNNTSANKGPDNGSTLTYPTVTGTKPASATRYPAGSTQSSVSRDYYRMSSYF